MTLIDLKTLILTPQKAPQNKMYLKKQKQFHGPWTMCLMSAS